MENKNTINNFLTWEDIKLIDHILEKMVGDDIAGEFPEEMTDEEYYTEALNRFNDVNRGCTYIPSVWREENIKKSPSECRWATIDDDGNLSSGVNYYDADGREISKEEYERLTGKTLEN